MIAEADEHDGEAIRRFIEAMEDGTPPDADGSAAPPLSGIQRGALRDRLQLMRKGYQDVLLHDFGLLGAAAWGGVASSPRAAERSPASAAAAPRPRRPSDSVAGAGSGQSSMLSF